MMGEELQEEWEARGRNGVDGVMWTIFQKHAIQTSPWELKWQSEDQVSWYEEKRVYRISEF